MRLQPLKTIVIALITPRLTTHEPPRGFRDRLTAPLASNCGPGVMTNAAQLQELVKLPFWFLWVFSSSDSGVFLVFFLRLGILGFFLGCLVYRILGLFWGV